MSQHFRMEPLSVAALYTELCFDDLIIAEATSFVVLRNAKHYLLTNRHNVTGRDQMTGSPLDKIRSALPNQMKVHHNFQGPIGNNYIYTYYLLDENNNPTWYEHPTLKGAADLVAFPLPMNEQKLNPYPHFDLDKYSSIDFYLCPGDRVNVIGFPFGRTIYNNYALWITGFLASDFEINIDDKPKFFIDARTRTGQSGSPVVFSRNGENVLFPNSKTVNFTGTQLLGIYSGRINIESDIGVVWKIQAICELIDAIS